MSDFISYHENIYLPYQTVSYNSEDSSKVNPVFSDSTYGVNDRDKYLHEGSKMYEQRGMCSQSTLQSEGKSHSNSQENPYIGSFDKISSSIIRLLHEAKQRTVKVNASCKSNQSQSHLHSLKYLCSRDKMTDTWYMTQRKSSKNYHAMPEFLSNACNERSTHLSTPSGEITPSKTSVVDRLVLLNEETRSEENINGTRHFATGRRLYESGRTAQIDGLDNSKECVSNDKTRQRKNSHNKVERGRRSIISDRINEIKSLLPEHINRESCQEKGSTLQEAINYIKAPHSYCDRLELLNQKVRETEEKYNSIRTRIEHLESRYETDNSDNRRFYVQTSPKVNVDGIAQESASREGGYYKIRADVISMSKKVSTLDDVKSKIFDEENYRWIRYIPPPTSLIETVLDMRKKR